MKNTILKQTESDILSANNNFKNASVHGFFGKSALWVIRWIRKPLTWLSLQAKIADSQMQKPIDYNEDVSQMKHNALVDIEENITSSSKRKGRLEKALVKAEAKLLTKKGKKLIKAKREVLSLNYAILGERQTVGQSQNLHQDIAKNLNKKGLLHA